MGLRRYLLFFSWAPFNGETGNEAMPLTSNDISDAVLDQPFAIGDVSVEPGRNIIRSENGSQVVQPKIMKLLCVLAAESGETLSRDQLIQRVWDGIIVSDAAIDRAVCSLRKALGDSARHPTYIETVRKKGIRLMVAVSAPQDEQKRDVPRLPPLAPAFVPAGAAAIPRFLPHAVALAAIALLAVVAILPRGGAEVAAEREASLFAAKGPASLFEDLMQKVSVVTVSRGMAFDTQSCKAGGRISPDELQRNPDISTIL